ncbi:hypothetical protein MCO_01626 [Bartonella sp. DB5-6]|uniref:hypothetical protein n=1 Tax=Bartonella sp. DB5-6 TaxID=1094755 RepID=UPI00026E9621|nr:hypothetical protein [Bartonella sp. DB5-6]EJF76269.1 hypothetical protein MCO_01626 [Bartonella sp. DB5-6]
MNIRYIFSICIFVLCFFSTVQACDSAVIQREKSVITSYNISGADLFSRKQIGSLFNEVVILSVPENHGTFWKSVVLMFQKVKQVYVNLGRYLYASIFSIFNW